MPLLSWTLGSPVEYCLHRGAYRLIPAMNTPHPATGTPHPFLQFFDQPRNMLSLRLVFLDESDPTDPLVASKWGEILPCCQCSAVGSESLSQVRRHLMYRTAGNSSGGHMGHHPAGQ